MQSKCDEETSERDSGSQLKQPSDDGMDVSDDSEGVDEVDSKAPDVRDVQLVVQHDALSILSEMTSKIEESFTVEVKKEDVKGSDGDMAWIRVKGSDENANEAAVSYFYAVNCSSIISLFYTQDFRLTFTIA